MIGSRKMKWRIVKTTPFKLAQIIFTITTFFTLFHSLFLDDKKARIEIPIKSIPVNLLKIGA
jgi:hypothetical protein